MSREILQDIVNDFSPDKFVRFFREKNRSFAARQESVTHYDDESFGNGLKLGDIKFSESEKLIICAFQVKQSLSERSGKKAQYEKGKKILNNRNSYGTDGITQGYRVMGQCARIEHHASITA